MVLVILPVEKIDGEIHNFHRVDVGVPTASDGGAERLRAEVESARIQAWGEGRFLGYAHGRGRERRMRVRNT